eukprot:CAMPEP_0170178062 /NCGR_PEP_ID=MMETSP0040_2-20121228/11643_1 /TAXON_ID=641309 /ORGANISM="Lotharella oceanica, Strain CCMP622" /LENGTH=157 /DNA_ID=CAMNT_0010421017 /DNA_START=268 /DNA_END=741 /DNA_ORIENTATION=+
MARFYALLACEVHHLIVLVIAVESGGLEQDERPTDVDAALKIWSSVLAIDEDTHMCLGELELQEHVARPNPAANLDHAAVNVLHRLDLGRYVLHPPFHPSFGGHEAKLSRQRHILRLKLRDLCLHLAEATRHKLRVGQRGIRLVLREILPKGFMFAA